MYINGRWFTETKVKAYVDKLIEENEKMKERRENLKSLAEQIAHIKRSVKSENSDYLTGYISALSAVEGMIAEMDGGTADE